MNIFIFLPAFIVFLYSLYKLVKDDYVFIRRNVSSEQMFDIAFIVTWVSLIVSRLFFFILNPFTDKNIFFSFFTLDAHEFSLLGLVLGAIGALALIGKVKKLPTSRLFDFFSVAFVVALPVGLFSVMFFFREYILFLYFINTLVYSFFAYYFIRYFQPKLAVFLFFFSLMSLVNSVIIKWLQKGSFITIENVLLVLLFFVSIVVYIQSRRIVVVSKKKL